MIVGIITSQWDPDILSVHMKVRMEEFRYIGELISLGALYLPEHGRFHIETIY